MVPEEYPEAPPELHVKSTNFHCSFARPSLESVAATDARSRADTIVNMAIAQAEHLGRKCVQGCTPEQVLRGTNAADLASGDESKREIHLTTSVVHDLKHDMRYLQQAADMKAFTEKTQKGNNKAHYHSSQDRKKMRRALRKLNKVGRTPRRTFRRAMRLSCCSCAQKEAEADAAKEEAYVALARSEAKAATTEASTVPQHSLFAMVRCP